MALSQSKDGQNVSTNGEQLQADQGLQACMFVFCQTAQAAVFSVILKFIIYRECMKQSFNYM
jgi:hypothetical protein